MKHLISFVANHVEIILTFIFAIPTLYFLGRKEGTKTRLGTSLKIVAVVLGVIVLGMCYQNYLWSCEPEQGQMIIPQATIRPVIKIISAIIAVLIVALITYLTKKKPERTKEYLKKHGKFLVLSVILITVGALLSH